MTELLDAETGIGDALAAAAGTAAGGVEVAGHAVLKHEIAGEAAGGLDAQPHGAPPQTALDVTEVVFESADGGLQLASQLLETQLVLAEPLDEPLAEGGGLFRARVRAPHRQ
jgi:hypothetical protein